VQTAGSLDTAVAHACTNVPLTAPDRQVAEVRRMLAGRRYDSASHVVVREGDRFAGIVRIEDLLAAGDDATIRAVMDANPPTVGPGVDQEVAAWSAVRRSESALAVVDANRAFVGLIPPDRLLAVLLAEHEEDLSRLGGILARTSAARMGSEEPVDRRFRHRLPWLLLGLAGSLLAADLVASFASALEQHIMLAFFIPAIVYLADAVGTQTETVIVRGLSIGVRMRHMAARELATGIAIGLVIGLAAGVLVWMRWSDPALALTVMLTLGAACTTATLTAMALPALLDALGRDPAFASGPLATVIQDLLSILIYFLVAAQLIS
jgi:magnesium transporter